MKITVDSMLRVSDAHVNTRLKIASDLTFKNQKYQQAISQGRHWTKEKETLSFHKFDKEVLLIPRGYTQRLREVVKETNDAITDVIDNTLTLEPVSFDSTIKLKDFQEPAVSALVKAKQGGIVSPCGSGKTIMLLEAVARIRQPTLWITHTKELLDQAIERASTFLNLDPAEIGRIESGKVKMGERLTVGLVQTLAKQKDIAQHFGCIVVDEAHHLAAETFFSTVGEYPALFRLWASATPERNDGLSKVVEYSGGPIVHEIKQGDINSVMIPELEVVKTGHKQTSDDYQKALTGLVADAKRNKLIVHHILQESEGNYSLVLSDRIEHIEYLKQLIQEKNNSLSVETLTGKMSRKQRQEIMERAKGKGIDILLATQLAREGLDLTHLNRLHLTTPKKAAGATQQEVGRIMRKCPGKKDCKLIDYYDENTFFAGGFRQRLKVYQKMGMQQGS